MILNAKRGMLIAVEGGDRCGKSTQCAALQSLLEKQLGMRSVCIKFPDRSTAIGKIINEYLSSGVEVSDRAIHLLFSANRWEAESRILSLLLEGTSVICDRYVPSGIAYSAAKGLGIDWCAAPDNGLPKPDMTFFMELPVELAAQRANYGEERYERIEFQRKVQECFTKLQDDSWIVVDASQPVAAITETLQRKLTAGAGKAPEQIQKYNFHNINY